GSQRAALKNPALARTYSVAREAAPTAMLIANIGAPQLVVPDVSRRLSAADLRKAVDMVGAQALAIHLNFLEESVQPEGNRHAAGLREALADAVQQVDVPVIGKETGAGLSRDAALELRSLGFGALDVGGLGGTSFAAIEAERASARGDARGHRLGQVFRGWGIPTAVSVVGARASGLPLIATGGLRTGLDAAKAIALGASLVGVARPLLEAALEGESRIDEWIHQFLEELRVAVWLSGGTRLADLQTMALVVSGELRTWLDDLGYSVRNAS
ncbi:MAG TPA: alpha-hydroxy-acid oxidizing protein, partial [Candidatus Dormibacteraeota bacterium]|nr:alpha-hydroxy-acid oxidizing protein [Candidatus Dormibacteraeota bacterium]